MTIKRNRRKAGEHATTYDLPPQKLEQREKAFLIYRDMGRAGSLVALERELKQNHPAIAASRPTLEKWSTQHQWYERVRTHDAAVASQAIVPTPALGPEFDQVEALMNAARLALTRALQGAPVVTKASDMKTLVDCAANAVKLVEAIRDKQGDKRDEAEIVKDMKRVLDALTARRRKDAVEMAKAMGISPEVMRQHGLTEADGVPEEASASLPKGDVRSGKAIEIDVGTEENYSKPAEPATMSDDKAKPSGVAAPPQPAPNGLPRFTDVIKTFRSQGDAGGMVLGSESRDDD